MISKTYTKSATTTKSKQLFDQLVYPMVRKTYDKVPSNQSYQQTKSNPPDSNSKRIRTEGNDQNALESGSSVSPPRYFMQQGSQEYVNLMEEKVTAKSQSPISGQPMNLLIKNLLAQSKKRNSPPQQLIMPIRVTSLKKPIRETRNQSADFQMLLKPSQSSQSPPTQKKKFQSYGNLNDHIYFTQRGQTGEAKRAETYSKLHEYYRDLLSKRGQYQHTVNIYKQQPKRPLVTQTPPVMMKLTLAQIKEQLRTIRSKMSSHDKTAKRKQSCEQGQQSTQKKQAPIAAYEDSGKRIRTENSQPSMIPSRQSFIREEEDTEGYQFRFYEPEPKLTKTLEEKIDVMWQEISKLKKKSEQLEEQNQRLFENLSKIQKEKETSSDERVHLLMKLDHMIEMQRKQEENLSFFKNIFQNPPLAESVLNRRIKTDIAQEGPQVIQSDRNASRPHNVKSEHNA